MLQNSLLQLEMCILKLHKARIVALHLWSVGLHAHGANFPLATSNSAAFAPSPAQPPPITTTSLPDAATVALPALLRATLHVCRYPLVCFLGFGAVGKLVVNGCSCLYITTRCHIGALCTSCGTQLLSNTPKYCCCCLLLYHITVPLTTCHKTRNATAILQ